MSVPGNLPVPLRLRMVAGLTLLFLGALAYAKGPEPPLRIALQPMGFQPPGAGVMASVGSTSTVHFIDDQHLLVTFPVRRLMARLPDDPPDDEDRTIDAVVVHLPSGKVLARTSWRLHDSSQYLWDLGHGRFLLRMRNSLTTFMPLENLTHGESFTQEPFLKSDRKLAAILLSPDRDLITIETVQPPPVSTDETSPASQPSSPESRRTQLNFYRILQPSKSGERMIVQAAGVAVAAGLVNLSITAAGYIEVLQESATRWLFDFDPYVGKFVELSPVESSCRPRPVFVSSSEFVAFGCRGGDDKLMLGGFNMRGEQMWQQNFTDVHAYPSFAFSPNAGRFALSRNIVASTAGITVDFAPATFTTQEIRVYQTYNGKQLLRVEASPVQRWGQNFDLSQDGLRLAVIRDGAVELYRLPALLVPDETAVKAARALEPKDEHANVSLVSHLKSADNASAFHPETKVAPESAPAAAGNAASTGDDQPVDGTRKAPTLYTLPTDKPADKPKSTEKSSEKSSGSSSSSGAASSSSSSSSAAKTPST